MPIQVLHRAFDILALVSGREMGLAELSEATGVQKTTLCNILKTLTELGALRRTLAGRYTVGPTLVQLAAPEVRSSSLLPLGQRTADELSARVREMVVVSALRGVERFVIGHAPGPQELTVRFDSDQPRSPYDAPTGRVLLAHLSPAELETVVRARGLPGDEWAGITDRTCLDAALREIREAGLALKLNAEKQVQTLAAPIFGPDGRVWAGIGISMPASRFQGDQRGVIVTELREAAARMSDILCYRAPGRIDPETTSLEGASA